MLGHMLAPAALGQELETYSGFSVRTRRCSVIRLAYHFMIMWLKFGHKISIGSGVGGRYVSAGTTKHLCD